MEVFNKPSKKTTTEDIHLCVRFSVPPSEIVRAITDNNMVQFYTRAPASIENKVGGRYIIFDGAIMGQFLKIDNSGIEMKWRKRDWEDGVYSIATIRLDEIEHALTEVTIDQTNIPKFDKFGNSGVVNSVLSGWMDQIFRQISNFLGFNLILEKDFD
ncbi:hypothetical protein WA158_003793 [Blastocystis sp. Blastoise]